MLSTFASLADFIGIFAFALAGIMSAQHRSVDPVGVFVLAFTTAFGGGIFRDVIIDNRPYYWVENEAYVWMTIALAALAPAVISRFKRWFAKSVFIWLDAVGLGFFSVSGTALCLEAGLPPLSSSILGVCTGAMGGMLGILIAVGASWALTGMMGLPFAFDPAINLVSFLFAALTGIVFGYFPARRAARLDPIEAVRHE